MRSGLFFMTSNYDGKQWVSGTAAARANEPEQRRRFGRPFERVRVPAHKQGEIALAILKRNDILATI